LLAVLIDSSASIGMQSDPEAGRETVRQAVRDALALEPGLDVRLYSFGAELRDLENGDLTPDSILFDSPRTDIAAALSDVSRRHADDNFQGLVLISDGRFNTGRNPVFVAERFPVPIYSATVGDTIPQADLRITRLTTNEITYVGNELPVEVSLTSDGLEGRTVFIDLLEEEQVVQRQRIVTPPDGVESTVVLSLQLNSPGVRRLRARVTTLPEEVTGQNNVKDVRIRVLESRRNIFVLAASPGPDLSALLQVLRAEEDLDVTVRTQKQRQLFYEGPMPADLTVFDALILLGYPGSDASIRDIGAVAEALEEGHSALYLLSKSSDLELMGDRLGPILGFVPEQLRRGTFEASPVLTSEGRRHPIIANPERSQQAWQRLPPLVVTETRWRITPDVRTLATYAVRGIALSDPLLMVRERGDLRTVSFLGSGFWRWANVPDDLDGHRDEWRRVVLRSIRWLSSRRDDRLVRVTPVQPIFAGSESVRLSGQVYDESLDPVSNAVVEVLVSGPGDVELRATMRQVNPGLYETDLGPLPEGSYGVQAAASREGTRIGGDAGSFEVGSLGLESREPTADVALMRQVAVRTGGMHASGANFGTILDALRTAQMAPRVLEESEEMELWRHPALLGLVLLLLTTEWFLRKRSGLV
jgi:hypothetical protein